MIDRAQLIEDIKTLEAKIYEISHRINTDRKQLREYKRVLRDRKTLLLSYGGEE